MSQYGALGYAQHGWNAARILGHYYTGTALGTTDPAEKVRIQLVPATSSARITGARQAGSRKLDPAKTYRRQAPRADQVELLHAGSRVATFKAPLQVAGAGGMRPRSAGTAPTAA